MTDLQFLRLYKSRFKKIRIGSKLDGGYVISELPESSYDCFISCGISDNIDFEIDFCNNYNIDCLAFDGTINNIPNHTCSKNIVFYKKNIGEYEDDNTTTLKTYIETHKNIFLKMDIETWEYKWLRCISSDLLKNIAQITIELHFPFTLSEGVFQPRAGIMSIKEKIELISKLFVHHVLVHIHGNSVCGVTTVDNKIFPNVIECTFIRKDINDVLELDNSDIPDEKLDNINKINSSEISFSINNIKCL